MSNVNDFEDDDDTFYYEVEKIIQMIIDEKGVRQFEIKWKNYDSEYYNTWEPEHNLNCPKILEEFLKKEKKRSKKQGGNNNTSEDKGKGKERAQSADIERKVKDKKDKIKNRSKEKGKQRAHSLEYDRNKGQGKGKERARSSEIETSYDKLKELAEIRKPEAIIKKRTVFGKEDDNDVTNIRDPSTAKKQTTDKTLGTLDPKKRAMEYKNSASNKRKKLDFTVETQSSSESSKSPSVQTLSTFKRSANVPQTTVVELEDLVTIAKKNHSSISSAYPTSPSTKYPVSSTPVWSRPAILQQPKSNTSTSITTKNNTIPSSTNIAPVTVTSNSSPSSISTRSPPTPPQTFHTPPTSPLLQQHPRQLHHSSKKPLELPLERQNPSPRHWVVDRSDPTSPLKLTFNQPVQGSGSSLISSLQKKVVSAPSPPLPLPSPSISSSSPLVIRSENLQPIKRQTSRPDPRLTSQNVKKLKIQNSTAVATPFHIEAVLTKGEKTVSTIILEGKQKCFHEVYIKRLTSLISTGSFNEIRITSFLPLLRLNDFLIDRPFSILSINPKSHIVDLSKLKSFMQVNETVGVVSHPDMPTQALIVLPESDLKKLSNMPTDTGLVVSPHIQLCALFLSDLPPRPKMLLERIDTVDEDTHLYSFNRVADFLKFPNELKKLKSTHKFIAYGRSEASMMLTKAIKKQVPESKGNQVYVMLFDRYNDSLFSKSLTKHKKEPTTQIWEFGIPNLLVGEVLPACRAFPNNSGGFVTTDVQNIVQNPMIIDDISAQIEKFDEFPLVYGDWKFILPFDFMYQMKHAIHDKNTAEKTQLAMIAITVALSKGKVHVMRLWPSAENQTSVIQHMNHVIRNHYKYRQYFVYVDDVNSLSSEVKDQFPCLDFVQSKQLYATFS